MILEGLVGKCWHRRVEWEQRRRRHSCDNLLHQDRAIRTRDIDRTPGPSNDPPRTNDNPPKPDLRGCRQSKHLRSRPRKHSRASKACSPARFHSSHRSFRSQQRPQTGSRTAASLATEEERPSLSFANRIVCQDLCDLLNQLWRRWIS